MITPIEDLLPVAKTEDPMDTTDMANAILNAEQSARFIRMLQEQAVTLGICRNVPMKAATREINKMSLSGHYARYADENEDLSATTEKLTDTKLTLTCKKIVLPWETTEEMIEDNIEGESFEETAEAMFLAQMALDIEYLCWQGVGSGADALLKAFAGWVAQAVAGSNVVDVNSTVSFFSDVAFQALAAMPNKYKGDGVAAQLRWLFSTEQHELYMQHLVTRTTDLGDAVLENGIIRSILGIPVRKIASLPSDAVVLCNPKNLVVGIHRDVKLRIAKEGKSAIMNDKRYYNLSMRLGCDIEWDDAVVLVDSLATSYDVTSASYTVTEV